MDAPSIFTPQQQRCLDAIAIRVEGEVKRQRQRGLARRPGEGRGAGALKGRLLVPISTT